MKTRDIENNIHDIESHLRHLEAAKDHEAAINNPQEELKKLRHLLPASLNAAQKNSNLTSRVAHVTERLDAACKKWEGDAYLDILTRHYTEYQSWKEQCQAPGKPRFDWRVPGMRVLAEAYDKQAGKEACLRLYSRYFSGPGYDEQTLEVAIERPTSRDEARLFVETGIKDGTIVIPFDYKLDSKSFISDYVTWINVSMGERWRQVMAAMEGKHIDAMRAAMEEEYDLKRFKPATIAKLHSLAWEEGHHSGFDNVKAQYPDLVDLLETTLD